MGAAYVDVTIRNPAAPARSWTGRFLVDTGAFNSLAPRRHLEAIGLEPKVASRHRVDLRYRLRRSYPSGILGILGIRVILTCRA